MCVVVLKHKRIQEYKKMEMQNHILHFVAVPYINEKISKDHSHKQRVLKIIMKNHYRLIILTLCLTLNFFAQASNLEFPALQNIKQITTPSMGFEKAGESYFSPDGKTLIFQAVPTGEKNYQIYSINIAEGSSPQLVSSGLGACTCAFFRPDGEKIIFASSHEAPNTIDESSQKPGYQRDTKNYVWEFTPYMNIYQANPDGSALKALTHGSAYSAECAYSADGSRIVLASNRSGDMNLYTMFADGSELQQHTFTTNVYNGGPFFSPDGTKIIYRADPETKHYLQIYYLNLQTGEQRQLTANNAINWAPFWHPKWRCNRFYHFTPWAFAIRTLPP
jgi:TolB protein